MQLKPRSDSLELSANHHSSVQKPALAFEQRARHVDYTQAPSQITSLFPLRAKLSHGPQHESLTTVFTGCCSWDHRDTVWKGGGGGCCGGGGRERGMERREDGRRRREAGRWPFLEEDGRMVRASRTGARRCGSCITVSCSGVDAKGKMAPGIGETTRGTEKVWRVKLGAA